MDIGNERSKNMATGEQATIPYPIGIAVGDTRRMDYPQALTMVRQGARISRRGWNGPGQFIELQVPDAHSKMTQPYTYITTTIGDRVPWVPSQSDQMADDWYVIGDEPTLNFSGEPDPERA
jgi:hypothetical protein